MSFDSTALLYPAYKDDNQTRGGLGRVCAIGTYRSIGHVEFPKSQTGIVRGPVGGGGVLRITFAGYVPLASRKPLPHYSLFCGQL